MLFTRACSSDKFKCDLGQPANAKQSQRSKVKELERKLEQVRRELQFARDKALLESRKGKKNGAIARKKEHDGDSDGSENYRP